MITLTHHAIQRGWERLRLRSDVLSREAERAYERGLQRMQTSGRLRRYLDGSMMRHHKGNELRLYSNHVWVFQDGVLITVLDLPHEFRRAVEKKLR